MDVLSSQGLCTGLNVEEEGCGSRGYSQRQVYSERRGGEDASGRQDAAWPEGRSCSPRLPSLRLKPVTIPEAPSDLSPSSQTSGTSKLHVAVPRQLACFSFWKEAVLWLKCIFSLPHVTHMTGTFLYPPPSLPPS